MWRSHQQLTHCIKKSFHSSLLHKSLLQLHSYLEGKQYGKLGIVFLFFLLFLFLDLIFCKFDDENMSTSQHKRAYSVDKTEHSCVHFFPWFSSVPWCLWCSVFFHICNLVCCLVETITNNPTIKWRLFLLGEALPLLPMAQQLQWLNAKGISTRLLHEQYHHF